MPQHFYRTFSPHSEPHLIESTGPSYSRHHSHDSLVKIPADKNDISVAVSTKCHFTNDFDYRISNAISSHYIYDYAWIYLPLYMTWLLFSHFTKALIGILRYNFYRIITTTAI